jgi:hypothetical protein
LFDLTPDHTAKLRPKPCLRFCTVRGKEMCVPS